MMRIVDLHKTSALLLSTTLIFSTAGCRKKNSGQFSLPGAGVSSSSIFIPQIDTTGSNDKNRIFVFVTDQLSNPILNFKLGNFSITEGGDPGVPYEVGNVAETLYLTLVIDRSGSMGGSKEAAANAAAMDLVNALGPTDQAAILEFESTVTNSSGFTSDKAVLNAFIAAGVSSGGTALYDATSGGASMLQDKPGRRMLVVLTDGEDNSSTLSMEGAIDQVNHKGLSAYMVGLGTAGIDFDDAVLTRMATATGGTFASSTDGTTLTAIFLGILTRFDNLVYVKYRRRSKGTVKVYLNYGSITAQAEKALD